MEDTAQPNSNGHATLIHQASSLASDEHTFEFTDIQPPRKRDASTAELTDVHNDDRDKRRKGVAPIKEEFLIKSEPHARVEAKTGGDEADDDAAEAFHHKDRRNGDQSGKSKREKKNQGQNKARQFGSSRDEVGLCSSRAYVAEFSAGECRYGEKCKFEHDLRRYLKQHKREDLTTFGGLCPVYEVKGKCNVGWKCRFVGSHSKEIEHEDGRKELVLLEDAERIAKYPTNASEEDGQPGVVNVIGTKDKIDLTRKRFPTPKSDLYIPWLDSKAQRPDDQGRRQKRETERKERDGRRNSSSPEPEETLQQENRARFVDPPFRPSEKRRIYFGAETPVLAPLTTQGNLPFRRLCKNLGASFTYSEMAMSLPLLQGGKSEWALLKAHESEIQPPTFISSSTPNVVYDYNHSTDLTFGAQIAAAKPWQAIKATEALTTLLPTGLRVVDLNCGCPIDLVYREGAGSALMDSPNKLEKILRGMSAVSGSTPVTVKIRTGTRDKQPTAQKLVDRLVLGAEHSRGNPCGVAAITLHGRSRQQRYTKTADWEYIASTSSLITNLNARAANLVDTVREADARDQPNTSSSGAGSGTGTKNPDTKVFFLGNGDVYSHVHYDEHIRSSQVDTCMLARGALIKPWLFEEIATNQYLDKTSSERLAYIESFCRYGLEAWGSDEIGVGQTRRFLLEWLSFACRYVPVGLLEYLPPNIQDRPPRFRGRDELETLMASDNYKDWIKLSEMFLGPAHKDFRFEPKHKSNAYEAEG